MDVLDRADELELRDLVHQVQVVEALDAVAIALMDRIDPHLAGPSERPRAAAFSNRDLRRAGRLRYRPAAPGYDHIVRRGGRVRDANWRHDGHWAPGRPPVAAEALLEHLRRRPDTCARGPLRTPAPVAAGAADASTMTTMFDADPLHAARELELPGPERPEHAADG